MRHGLGEAAGALALALALTGSPGARAFEKPDLSVAGPADSRWRLEVSNRIRGEFVDWFDPGQASPQENFRHDFLGNRFQAGVRVIRDPLEVFFQYQHTVLEDVPDDGPGPGGVYFANTRRGFQEQAWLRQGWVKGHRTAGDWRFALTVGRQLYADGAETTPRDPSLAWLKQFRVAERLLGPFDYTHVGRSFDGFRMTADHATLNLTGFAFRPTSGGFEVSAGRDIPGIDLAGVSATLKDRPGFDRTEARLFWVYYADDRPHTDGVVVLDNRALAARAADRDEIQLSTLGGNLARVEPVGPGRADVLAWAAGQFGDWQSQTHRAWAWALEAGYQLPDVWSRPWLRAGFFRSAGDRDPDDGRHETFFQMLPTARLYAQFPFYNLMNNQDTFVQAILAPSKKLTIRPELHWLRATEGTDFVYAGGGATKDDFFGFAGVPSAGNRQIGYLADVSFTYRPHDVLTLYAYYGHAFGEDVISDAFVGRDANYGYVELTLAF
jgi:hypothetical protein